MPLEEKLRYLPDGPGVYIFKDKAGRVIYVGKALSLKNRVRSYFQSGAERTPKVNSMLKRIDDLDYIATDTEVEALILESNLIKEHRPRYNVLLRDDKSYPYLKITLGEDFPRVYITRRINRDGSRYFGPYTKVGAVNETLRLIKKLFPFRSCKQKKPGPRSRPCLNYHIKRCLAPCCNLVNKEEYRAMINEVCLFLEGRQDDLIKSLTKRMEAAAQKLEFEKAAKLRDQIKAVQEVVEKQKIVSTRFEDQDIIGMARWSVAPVKDAWNLCARSEAKLEKEAAAPGEKETAAPKKKDAAGLEENGIGQSGMNQGGADYAGRTAPGEFCVIVFFVRGGKLIGKERFLLKGSQNHSNAEILTAFLKQYYSQAEFVPREVLLPEPVEDAAVIEEWLTGRRGARVYLKVPARGAKRQMVAMAGKNARLALEELEAGRRSSRNTGEEAAAALAELAGELGLEGTPRRVECYDISNIQGSNSVGSMVVFENGLPKKEDYRKFKIRSVKGPDDFASLQEVLRRRFARAEKERELINTGQMSSKEAGFCRLPDLIIVDGGKGQLSAARGVMRELGYDWIPAFGLAKEEELLYGEESPEPVRLPRNSKALYFLQRLRDEAHRFAVGYHRRLRGKNSLHSVLDDIKGIGEVRRRSLLQKFGSVEEIKKATVDELASVPGMNRRAAEAVYSFFQAH